jgi:hypothetical protein
MAKRKKPSNKKITIPLADVLEYRGAYTEQNYDCAIFGLENRVKKKNRAINKGLISFDDVANRVGKENLIDNDLLSVWGAENIELANSDLQSSLTYCKEGIERFKAGEIDLEKLILHSISFGFEVGRAGLIGLALHGHKSLRQKQTATQKKSKLIDEFVSRNYEAAYKKLKESNGGGQVLKKEITAELVDIANENLGLKLMNVDRVLTERLTDFYREKVLEYINQSKFKAISEARKNKGLLTGVSALNAEYEKCLLSLVRESLEAGIYQPLYKASEKTQIGLASIVSAFLVYEAAQSESTPLFEYYVNPLHVSE